MMKWAPRDESNAGFVAKSIHFPLFFSVEEVVPILHTHKFGPAILLGNELQTGELVSPHGAGADIVDPTGLYKIMKGFHGLLGRH